MRLAVLIRSLEAREVRGTMDLDIRDITYHSHLVKEGDLFVAIKGEKRDGHHFIHESITRGARAVVVEELPVAVPDIPLVVVQDSRKALALISAAFFAHPSREMTLVGITGTSGKTTTSYLIESIMKAAGKTVGVIGTINYRLNGRERPAPTTTPQSYDLQQLLREMVTEGIANAVMEVSSHALDQERVRGCHFDAAVFTNISPEHLDYHEDMDTYFAAKKRLFCEILPESEKAPWAIFNIDDPLVKDLPGELASRRILTYGLDQGDVRVRQSNLSLKGTRAILATPSGTLAIETPLIGEYNLSNIMAATAVGIALDIPAEAIRHGIKDLSLVPGRMEQVGGGRPWVLVDYAHKPEALEKSLQEIKRLTRKRVLVVFGCGGDRDRSKRAPMGRIGVLWSDLAIITSDNPRTEDPLQIIAEIERGAKEVSPPRDYLVIPDRKEAIKKAIALAGDEDCVLITGKGHEDYQIIGEQRFPFDDRQEARSALEARDKKQ
ncbi:MAG: UDP-N-acetylmuramoyl-L-alanyl-D-glutamate--2,6-diaminopimelate ligase [Deltaproteobacteria bacterium RBG_16_54_18]|nr:MAG: UDP-N-acetylmuramoyl-L-alanyl-D-glutamate--2,6-diaminopimelate ligase [Deltaproteobacteria bacterium RBG_16_54_18]